MKKNTIKGFTLVELIVVMTAVTILSGLAFVSYQGNTSKARDSKRKSDITNIVNKMEVSKIAGNDIFSFVSNTGSRIFENINIAGYEGGEISELRYNAGDIDFVYLDIVGESFLDPRTNDKYKGGVTSFQNRYEVAATLENEGDTTIFSAGTWLPREVEETIIPINRIYRNTVFLSGATKSDLLFHPNDRIIIGTGGTSIYTIKRIFDRKIELDRNIDPIDYNIDIRLLEDESPHIIKNWNSDFPIEKGRGGLFTPYDVEN